jgi:branched-chain amino acid transport system substrate-binding protein
MCRLATVAIVTLLAALGGPARSDILIGVASPMTGPQSWGGEQFERAAEMALADLNAKGGVLGHSVELIIGDDFCDPDQAVALARKLVSDGVVFVAGHRCSHSSISAAKVYEDAKIPMISPGSASARLTDEGGPNVFRLWGRDDQQGAMVGDYLAEHWADKEIAILDDGTVWGLGVANAVRRTLRERGVRVAVDETLTPGEVDYSPLVSKMQAGSVDVFFLGGYLPETGLIFRQAHDRGYDVQLIASSAVATADLPLIAGPALEGSVMIATADMRTGPEAAEVVGRFRAQGYEPLGNTLYVYAAVQVWAQAVARPARWTLMR